jgi:hypothetical protein
MAMDWDSAVGAGWTSTRLELDGGVMAVDKHAAAVDDGETSHERVSEHGHLGKRATLLETIGTLRHGP